jgi:hypothetical protein
VGPIGSLESARGASARAVLSRWVRRFSVPRSLTIRVFLEESPGPPAGPVHDSYLVDSASSHMLVSKIKPCMSKYKQLYRETANGSLYQLSFI